MSHDLKMRGTYECEEFVDKQSQQRLKISNYRDSDPKRIMYILLVGHYLLNLQRKGETCCNYQLERRKGGDIKCEGKNTPYYIVA